MKKVDIVFGGVNIGRTYTALIENNESLIKHISYGELDDNLSEEECVMNLIDMCKREYNDLCTDSTEPRACAYVYDENDNLLCSYEINDLLHDGHARKYNNEELREERMIMAVDSYSNHMFGYAALAIGYGALTAFILITAVDNRIKLMAVNNGSLKLLAYDVSDIMEIDRNFGLNMAIGGITLIPGIGGLHGLVKGIQEKRYQKTIKKVK